MTSQELVRNAAKFQGIDRLPLDFPEPYGSDFAWTGMSPSPDARPGKGIDEWGAVWDNIGVCNLGEVKSFPLKDWAEFDKLKIPDVRSPHRWGDLSCARESAGKRFLLAAGVSLYERVHFVRGLENTWTDIYEHPDELGRLLDILVDMNLVAVDRYARSGVDGLILSDDWGLQDRLMISPGKWREIWKPRYAQVFGACHDAGLITLMHSCGNILEILDDLIEAGLDVIQMDQQENMGLETLGSRFGGRICFWCPVDIQKTMSRGSLEEIRTYCWKMFDLLGRPEGGFIPKWYADPLGAGHSPEAVKAMCEEFLQIGCERYGNSG